MAVSNKKNVSTLPINTVEAEERLCAPTVYTDPLDSSFTLMLVEPEETIRQSFKVILVHININKFNPKSQ